MNKTLIENVEKANAARKNLQQRYRRYIKQLLIHIGINKKHFVLHETDTSCLIDEIYIDNSHDVYIYDLHEYEIDFDTLLEADLEELANYFAEIIKR